jgi:hypothetical protein
MSGSGDAPARVRNQIWKGLWFLDRVGAVPLWAALPLLGGKGKDELLAEGKSLIAAMGGAVANHEVKRLKDLPDAVKAFRAQKGLLYIGLKRINDAGGELHSGDARAAAQYNLTILHRHAPKKKDDPNAPSAEAPKA